MARVLRPSWWRGPSIEHVAGRESQTETLPKGRSVVLREMENAASVFAGDFALEIGRELVEEKDDGLPALRTGREAGRTVMLIGADDEAIWEVLRK